MKVTKTIKPDAPGAQRFLKTWGKKLVAVRYREDHAQYLTTIEIIVDQRFKLHPNDHMAKLAWRKNHTVALKIAFEEAALRIELKRHGAKFSKHLKLWITRYDIACRLALADRIVPGAAERCQDVCL